MNADWQTPVALFVALAALALLVRGAIAKRKKPGCSSGVSCPTDAFKARLHRDSHS